MRAKLKLTKNFGVKRTMEESSGTRNVKNVTFVPKNVHKIPSSHKISRKYNEQ